MKSFYLSVLILNIFFLAFTSADKHNGYLQKTNTNDAYNFIHINRIKMFVSNNGDGSHDPATDGNGLYWGESSAVFEDGLIFGGKIADEIRVSGNTHRQGLQAGKILADGTADDPSDPRYRVYKVHRYWRDMQPGSEKDAYRKDHEEWPADDGAPWIDTDKDGKYNPEIDHPDYIGDEMLWFVSNDLDEQRTNYSFGSLPMGIEVQTKVFAFNKPNILGDIVFKNYRLINKSNHDLNDFYAGYWSDPDLGDANNDFVGCDTLLSIAYCYNGQDFDNRYIAPQPAVGYVLLNNEKPGMTSFLLWLDTFWSPDYIAAEYYNYLMGLYWNANPFINPVTNDTTKFLVAGDPVTGTGWYEGAGWPGGPQPDDRRMMMSSGPYQFKTGDTLDFCYAISVRRGTDRLDSITELREAAKVAHELYNNNYQPTAFPAAPVLNAYEMDRRINLYWDSSSENYNQYNFIDKTYYLFEGYRLWQYNDANGNNPQLLATYDLKNGQKVFYDFQWVNGIPDEIPVISGKDEGVMYSKDIIFDSIMESPMYNGSPYYFGITAFAYSQNSVPRILESPPSIITVVPGLKRIDQSFSMAADDIIQGKQINGHSDGQFQVKVIDPDAIIKYTYKAVVHKTDTFSWTLINSTIGDTLFKNNFNLKYEPDSAFVFDGLKFMLQDQGRDSINALPGLRDYGVRLVAEISNANGPLENEIDVIKNYSLKGDWKITSYGAYNDARLNLNPAYNGDYIGFDNYEIRFTDIGSEYYLNGYHPSFRGPVTDDPKAKDRVPFEIWNIGRDLESDEDDYRLKIRIQDYNINNWPTDSLRFVTDSSWTKAPGGNWEPIFAFLETDSIYHDNLPSSTGRGRPEYNFLHQFVIQGELPEPGTVIRIYTWKPLEDNDTFSIQMTPSNEQDYAHAKSRLDEISVFPNPYFGDVNRSGAPGQGFVRFTNLPQHTIIRIYTLAGILARKVEKNDPTPWWDWDLRNDNGIPIASGIFIAHLDMPKIGNKIMKLAIVNDNYTIIDR